MATTISYMMNSNGSLGPDSAKNYYLTTNIIPVKDASGTTDMVTISVKEFLIKELDWDRSSITSSVASRISQATGDISSQVGAQNSEDPVNVNGDLQKELPTDATLTPSTQSDQCDAAQASSREIITPRQRRYPTHRIAALISTKKSKSTNPAQASSVEEITTPRQTRYPGHRVAALVSSNRGTLKPINLARSSPDDDGAEKLTPRQRRYPSHRVATLSSRRSGADIFSKPGNPVIPVTDSDVEA